VNGGALAANGGAVDVELLGVDGVDFGTLQILDSSAFTNFICELFGSQNCLICSCVTICGVAFTFTFAFTIDIPTILVMIVIMNSMMTNTFMLSVSLLLPLLVLLVLQL
jgi:hypothetical protein